MDWNEDLIKKVMRKVLFSSPGIDIKTFSDFGGKRWIIYIDKIGELPKGHLDIRFEKDRFQMSFRGNKGSEVFPEIKYADIESLYGFTPETAAEIPVFKFLGKPKHLRNERIFIG